MKRLFILNVFILLVLSTFTIAVSDSNPQKYKKNFEIPENAIEIMPGVFSLGKVKHNGKYVNGFAFVDYRKGYHHNPNHNGGPGGSGDASACFAFLAKGARWKTTEQYILDASNGDGLSEQFIIDSTEAGIEAWDSQVSFDIFGARNASGAVDGADLTNPDNKNELLFGDLNNPNAIAATIVWGIFSGPPSQRKLVEWDMIFNDAAFTFGDASLSSSLMDYQNVFTHEIGHAAGMAHPSDACTEETMFRFAEEGETKKRTLESGDISGVTELY